MKSSLNPKRVGFLLTALVCAGLALASPGNPTQKNDTHRVSGLYQSELLDDEVSIPTLAAFTYTEEFQDLVGASVRVEAVAESPFHIQITTELTSELGLLTAHKRAIHLLSAEVKEQALGEIKADLDYLKEVRRKAAKLGQARQEDEAKSALNEPARPRDILSAKDSQRVVFLREEIKNLESYLDGGELPKSVRARLDRESINAAEKRVRNQQAELSRLAKLFHPSSKAIQAQRGSVEVAQSDLAEIERHLADIYLRALRLELEILDDKASSRIQTSLATEQGRPGLSPSGSISTGSAWLDERQKELETRAETISAAASLKQEGKLTFSIIQNNSPLWTSIYWFSTILSVLLAVFSDPSTKQAVVTQSPGRSKPRRKVSPQEELEFNLARPTCSPDALECFFETIRHEICKTLSCLPRRLLVTGDSDTETRLSFSIRLANSLGRDTKRVRLIDFDFEEKGLSSRLGRHNLPGVSELILQGGPMEEFFSSISGTRIQFAPAGQQASTSLTEVQFERLAQVFSTNQNEFTVIDSSSNSPLDLVKDQVDVVLWTTRTGELCSNGDKKVLQMLQSTGLPVWGVSVEMMSVFPLE